MRLVQLGFRKPGVSTCFLEEGKAGKLYMLFLIRELEGWIRFVQDLRRLAISSLHERNSILLLLRSNLDTDYDTFRSARK